MSRRKMKETKSGLLSEMASSEETGWWMEWSWVKQTDCLMSYFTQFMETWDQNLKQDGCWNPQPRRYIVIAVLDLSLKDSNEKQHLGTTFDSFNLIGITKIVCFSDEPTSKHYEACSMPPPLLSHSPSDQCFIWLFLMGTEEENLRAKAEE